ncbi:MAG: NAD(P)/FAD-dependent oxidoreductase [Myxococcales bacterium]|nr:NAD(P)/FAD-dependent oxidoreductase [Myxococcales bacterium]
MAEAARVGQGSEAGLRALEERARRDLAMLEYPKREWVPPRTTRAGERVLDVLVVGGGQGGIATAFALRRERVENVLVVDALPAGREGPWRRFARMKTLRTPKHVLGPELGVPSLSVQAWYEAQHGEGSWSGFDFIERETWAAYLAWVRELLAIPVQNDTRVGAIRWDEDESCFVVPVTTHAAGRSVGTAGILRARKIVLATGIEGAGQWYVPPLIRDGLPKARWAHTCEPIDFAGLRGKRVAVLGAGASAFDNAAVALEHGAAKVDLYFRRPELVRVNVYRWAEFTGFLRHHADLPDAEKWRFVRRFWEAGQLPPRPTFERAARHEDFALHPGSPWQDVREVEREGETVLEVTTPKGTFHHDFVIVGTGFRTDLASRVELQAIEGHVARWEDRFEPPDGERVDELLRHPYLGSSFELTERAPGEAPWLRGIFCFSFGCLVSCGLGGASISGMKYGVDRLVGGITRQLYLEDAERHYAALDAYDVPDLEAV